MLRETYDVVLPSTWTIIEGLIFVSPKGQRFHSMKKVAEYFGKETGPSFHVLFSVFYYEIKPAKVVGVGSLIKDYNDKWKKGDKEGGMAKMQRDATKKYSNSPQNIYRTVVAEMGGNNPTPTQVLNYSKSKAKRKQEELTRKRNDRKKRTKRTTIDGLRRSTRKNSKNVCIEG